MFPNNLRFNSPYNRYIHFKFLWSDKVASKYIKQKIDRTEEKIRIHSLSQMYIFKNTTSATDKMRQKKIKNIRYVNKTMHKINLIGIYRTCTQQL